MLEDSRAIYIIKWVTSIRQVFEGLNQQIFTQWHRINPDYKIAAGIDVELYSDVGNFESVNQHWNCCYEICILRKRKKNGFLKAI